VPSTVSQADLANKVEFPFPKASATQSYPPTVTRASNFQVTALSIEFVAKPHEAHRAQLAIPPALAGALQEVTGFAGCLVMVSDQEARLLTVVTLWSGNERQKLCNKNLRWVRTLLAPYLDRCLRVQTLAAHLPALPAMVQQSISTSESSTVDCPPAEEETTCVA
jgi:hypothetical protein